MSYHNPCINLKTASCNFLSIYIEYWTWKEKGKRVKSSVFFQPLPPAPTWISTVKPGALEVCAVHVPAQYYNHRLMCASILAAISTIACQVGVFQRDRLCSKSYSEHEQVCKRTKWLTTKGTSMKQEVVLFNNSLSGDNHWLVEPQTGHDFILNTQQMWSIFFVLTAHWCTKMTTATESKI